MVETEENLINNNSFQDSHIKRISFFQVGPGIGPITNNNFRFANALAKRGYKVDLVGTDVHQDVIRRAPDSVRIFNLNSPSVFRSILPLIRYLKTENPDALFASGPTLHVASGLARALSGFQGKVIYRSHIETSLYLKERSLVNRNILRTLLIFTKRFCDYNIAASYGSAVDLSKILGVSKRDIGVMYNPAIDDEVLEKSLEPAPHIWLKDRKLPTIVTVARLAEQKSIDVLLRALSIIPKMRLIILGEGPLRGYLESLSGELDLLHRVDFIGHIDNPYPYMRQADLFVLSSAFEGFANVIAEALAVGCPVVSTDAPSGPAEILNFGEFGALVPVGDSSALASAILDTLDKPVDRERLIARGKRFHVETIVNDLLTFAGIT